MMSVPLVKDLCQLHTGALNFKLLAHLHLGYLDMHGSQSCSVCKHPTQEDKTKSGRVWGWAFLSETEPGHRGYFRWTGSFGPYTTPKNWWFQILLNCQFQCWLLYVQENQILSFLAIILYDLPIVQILPLPLPPTATCHACSGQEESTDHAFLAKWRQHSMDHCFMGPCCPPQSCPIKTLVNGCGRLPILWKEGWERLSGASAHRSLQWA